VIRTPTVTLPQHTDPEPYNMRCCKCGTTFGPRLGHDCKPRQPVPVDEAAQMLLSAAEHIFSSFELHGDTPLLATAIAAFRRARSGEVETAEQRAEREKALKSLRFFEADRRDQERRAGR